jgi:hypothetical protein
MILSAAAFIESVALEFEYSVQSPGTHREMLSALEARPTHFEPMLADNAPAIDFG